MARLVILCESQLGRSFGLKEGTTTVGRSGDNAFEIDEPSVSSHHCEIIVAGAEVIIRDLNSTNGTFINGQQIVGEIVLKPGQILRLGEIELRLDLGQERPGKPPLENVVGSRKTNPKNRIFAGAVIFVALVIIGIIAYHSNRHDRPPVSTGHDLPSLSTDSDRRPGKNPVAERLIPQSRPSADDGLVGYPAEPVITPAMVDVLTETWRAAEITFESANTYTDPLNAQELNVAFTSPSGKQYLVPGFWDGGKTWRVRFAPTEYGVWKYVTACTNGSDVGLDGIHGTLGANRYRGPLEIYRHGFIKTAPGVRYFRYADDTPFFYLGDTHWSMPQEPFEEMFKVIVNKRVAQGFTVYQSEPLGAKYDLADGFSEADLSGLQDLDRRFKYIADAGLVHANAELFFPPEIAKPCYTDDYLQKLCRLWVARFGAYPVLWTTAQEVDNDFYFDRGDQHYFDANSNPWKRVLAWVHEYDAYQHPGTAHMEFMGGKPEPKEFPPVNERPKWGYGVLASTSSFRHVRGHTWYGVQWSPPNNSGIDWPGLEDFWENGQGEPVVDYEGRYDHLWTLGEGARQQGWTAYLNGMFGHGYGAIDIWLYNSRYDMDKDTTFGSVTVTIEQKKTKWTTSVDFLSATELGIHMKNFFTSMEWWKLTPRFDGQNWFKAEKSTWYSLATIDSDVYVLYLYNWATTTTGILRNMRNNSYDAQWFNTKTGAYTDLGTVTPEREAQGKGCWWKIPQKPTASDWVLVVRVLVPAKGAAE